MTEGIRRALVRAAPASERFLRFEEAIEGRVATVPREVPGLLEWVETAAARGLWAVGYVGYEAAPAFDRAFVTRGPGASPAPLAAFALFDAPEEIGRLSTAGARAIGRPSASLGEAEYRDSVGRIREAIASGATYQVNYVFALRGSFSGRSIDLFASLQAPGEAPYAALLEGERWAIASLSPELFFERTGGRVVMRPMKGTRSRGRFGEEDRHRAAELAASEKDRAENLMIVDMVRNDLGRIARHGSVAVEERFALERYPTVWQMTSTVAGATEARLPELFAALFPCASITGAPKAATMRIIRELEREPRGAYCGAIGFVAPGGWARFSVAIRTLELDTRAHTYRYGVGSGITWDSSPAEEWRECLAKARVLDGAPPPFDLLETMRWRPERGIELLDLHLERLVESAVYFGFEKAGISIEGDARAAIAARCVGLAPRSHRIRLLLARDGALRVEAEPFDPARRLWSVTVARESIASADAIGFHKTTHRARYERARASAAGEADEVLLVNDRGELTEGTRTNLFVQFGGEWVTPPRDAGLLAGVFRAHLLRSGRIVEATLYPRDLARAHRIRLGNALRGWIPARLAEGFPRISREPR